MRDSVCAHVIISGKVQGVFFRAETQKAARRIGVRGWVRNRPEGTVEAVFEGDAQSVDQALAWCRQGSPMSRVSDLDLQWVEFKDQYDDFTIEY